MNELHFLEPGWLLALFALPLIWLLFTAADRSRTAKRAQLGLKSEPRLTLMLSVLLILFVSVLALSRPYIGFTEIAIPRSARDIALIVDVSKSMLARDIQPSRLESAKRKIYDILDYLKANSPGDRIALILFSGDSYLYCPFTSDYSVVRMFTKEISPQLISAQGSALESALKTAIESIKNVKALRSQAVLLSDGEDLSLSLSRAESLISQEKLKLDALGFGTPEGSPIEIARGMFIKDAQSQIVISKLESRNLESLSKAGGGHYYKARLDDSDVKLLLKPETKTALSSFEGQTSGSIRSYNEIGPYLLWIPALLILYQLLRGRLDLLFMLLLMPVICYGEDAPDEPAAPSNSYEAAKAYRQGDYPSALKGFKQQIEKGERSEKVLQGLGASYFKNGQYKDAEGVYNRLAESTTDTRTKFNSLYNLGNSKYALKDYHGAIQAYDQALQLKPADRSAEFNRGLAKQLLEEQEKEQKKDDSKSEENKDQQKQDKDQKKSDEEKKEQQKQDQEEKDQDKQEDKKEEEQQQSPTESPSASPSPSDSSDEQKNDEEEEGDATPSPTAKASAQPSPTAGEEEKKDDTIDQPTDEEPQSTLNPIDKADAQSWLDSLPEAPLLLRRNLAKKKGTNTQDW